MLEKLATNPAAGRIMRTNRPSNADILSNPKTPGSMRMHRERWGIMHRSKEHVQDGEANRQVVEKSGTEPRSFTEYRQAERRGRRQRPHRGHGAEERTSGA